MTKTVDIQSDEWKALTDDDRYEIVKAVIARFTRKFGNEPDVKFIFPGANDSIWIQTSIRIENEIHAGLAPGANRCHPDLVPEYDWDAARERVRDAIREMEASYANS
jgi:hypothetical protein